MVRGASRFFESARENRDKAIGNARREGLPLREIADAAGLSIPRIKQMAPAYGRYVPPVTDVDLILPAVPRDSDRVFGLEEVDPRLPTFSSEMEFVAGDRRRRESDRYDVGFNFCDLDPGHDRWVVVYVSRTGEVYTFDGAGGNPGEPEGWVPADGSWAGPCYLLGHLPTHNYRIASALLVQPAAQVLHRPGGLAGTMGGSA